VASPLQMTVTGFSYAVASLGCTIGPFLDVTATMFRASNILERRCGFRHLRAGLVVGVLAIGTTLMSHTAAGDLRPLDAVPRPDLRRAPDIGAATSAGTSCAFTQVAPPDDRTSLPLRRPEPAGRLGR
jgi:hypothetical protein